MGKKKKADDVEEAMEMDENQEDFGDELSVELDEDMILEIENTPEMELCEPGPMYLHVTGFVESKGNIFLPWKDGRGNYSPIMAILNDPDELPEESLYKPIFHFLPVPMGKMGSFANQTKRNYFLFHEACGVKIKKEFDPEEFIGKVFRAVVGIKKDPERGDKNVISQTSIGYDRYLPMDE